MDQTRRVVIVRLKYNGRRTTLRNGQQCLMKLSWEQRGGQGVLDPSDSRQNPSADDSMLPD